MQIIVPAYNVKADQATRYEAQIAAIMHMKRNEEINLSLIHISEPTNS